MYDSIRQGKAKTGMAEELTRRIKEEAIPIISDVEGFRAYYVVYAPDDTVTAISIFNDYAGAEELNKRALLGPLTTASKYIASPDELITGVPVIPSGLILPHGKDERGTGLPTDRLQSSLPLSASKA